LQQQVQVLVHEHIAAARMEGILVSQKKYDINWRMRMLFWLMRRTPSVGKADLQQMKAGSDGPAAKQMSRLLMWQYRIAQIEDRSIPGRQGDIPVRVYRPAQGPDLPAVVYFHGGGWVLGGLDGHDAICRRIAAENLALVISVAYRLAPEHKYPAAVEDAYDATRWVGERAHELGGAPEKLIVMGDSAGGNLAAVASLMARDLAGPHVAYQVLIYPAVDLSRDYPSKSLYDDTPVLDREALDFYRDQYIRGPADLTDPYVSPLLAADHRHLPPALILTGEYDPLRDEGRAYADTLRAAGVDVTEVCYSGMCHGFLSFGWLGSATPAAYRQIQRALAQFSAGAH
jgi:acetyl esterase/lipase